MIEYVMPDDLSRQLVEQMEQEGISPNNVTYMCILKSYKNIGPMDKIRRIHADIVKQGLLEEDIRNALIDAYSRCGYITEAQKLFEDLLTCNASSWNTLIAGYAKFGMLTKAQELFDKLPSRDIVSWNCLIEGYAEHGHNMETLKYFDQMQSDSVVKDTITFISGLKACDSLQFVANGQRIHSEIVRKGFIERDLFLGNMVVDMYAKCGSIMDAQQVFDKLLGHDTVSWNALLGGYVENGKPEKALDSFEKMNLEDVSADTITYVHILKACGNIGAREKGQDIHAQIVRAGLLDKDVMIGNALIDMYAGCGLLSKAQETLDKLPVQDAVSWNTLIAGYAEHEHYDQALSCLEQMQLERVSPNEITFTSILKSVANIGFTAKGQEIHSELMKKGYLESDLIVGNTLVDMYARCGSLHIAQEVLQRIQSREVVTWNALLSGYAQLGECENVFNIFDRMIGESIKPNGITFISVLKACSRTSLFFRGLTYFGNMSKDYGVLPTLEHNNCIIHLLNCAGELGKAVEMIYQFRCSDMMVWHSTLYACKNWGNLKLGRDIFEHSMSLI